MTDVSIVYNFNFTMNPDTLLVVWLGFNMGLVDYGEQTNDPATKKYSLLP